MSISVIENEDQQKIRDFALVSKIYFDINNYFKDFIIEENIPLLKSKRHEDRIKSQNYQNNFINLSRVIYESYDFLNKI